MIEYTFRRFIKFLRMFLITLVIFNFWRIPVSFSHIWRTNKSKSLSSRCISFLAMRHKTYFLTSKLYKALSSFNLIPLNQFFKTKFYPSWINSTWVSPFSKIKINVRHISMMMWSFWQTLLIWTFSAIIQSFFSFY